MKYTLTITIILVLLAGSVFATVYSYGPVDPSTFSIENENVVFDNFNGLASYDIFSQRCVIPGGTAQLTYPSTSFALSFIATTTLQAGQSQTFSLRESQTSTLVPITIRLTEFRSSRIYDFATGTYSCGPLQISFTVDVSEPSSCVDADGTSTQGTSSATSSPITSSRNGNSIDLSVGSITNQIGDTCSSSTVVSEAVCSGEPLLRNQFSVREQMLLVLTVVV